MSEKLVRFRANPTYEAPQRVDRENGVIYGYVVTKIGPMAGHGVMFDRTTLEQIVELGNAQGLAVKSRFTHPGVSSDGMGKFLGRSSNFRIDETTGVPRVLADLKLSKLSRTSPHGDLGGYVLDLAESDPDSFGASPVLMQRLEKQLDERGVEKHGADGKPLPQIVRVKALKAVDVVDDPASGASFFEEVADVDFDALPDAHVAQAFGILDSLFAGRESAEIETRVGSFLKRYFNERGLSMSAADTQAKPADDATQNKPAGEQAPAENATGEATAPATNGEATAEAKPVDATVTSPAAPAESGGTQSAPATAEAALSALNDRAVEISSLCNIAGRPDLATDFIRDRSFSVADVRTKLAEYQAKLRKPIGESAGGASGVPEAPKDPNAKYKADYAADPAGIRQRTGIKTEAEYVRACRMADGLEPMEPIAVR